MGRSRTPRGQPRAFLTPPTDGGPGTLHSGPRCCFEFWNWWKLEDPRIADLTLLVADITKPEIDIDNMDDFIEPSYKAMNMYMNNQELVKLNY